MTPAWQRRLPRARAALLALAVTAAFLLALNASLLRPVVLARPEQPALTVVLLRPPAPPTPAAAAEAALAPQPARPRRAVAPASALPSLADALPAAPAAAPEPAPVATAARPASVPLRLDDQVLRAAARYSISRTRELAEASGQTLGSGEPASAQERLSQAAARSAKPDCLGPNAGGSLLTLPLIAFEAATGQCK